MLGDYGSGGYGNSTSSPTSTTFKDKKFSFGNGYQIGLGFRYGFKNNFGIDFGYAYLLGQKNTTTSENLVSNYSYKEEIKSRISRVYFGFSYLDKGKKVSPIIKMGVLIAVGKVIFDYSNSFPGYNPNPPYGQITSKTESSTKYYGGVSAGFYSGLGINFKASDKVSLQLILDVVVQEFTPARATVTKSTLNGEDQLPKMTTYDKETLFVKNDASNGFPTGTSSPNRVNKISIPLSSFGPSFNIVFNIGKKKEATQEAKNTAL